MTTPKWVTDIEDKVLKNIPDCGDHSCEFSISKKGMRTNGGCGCTERSLVRRTPVESYARNTKPKDVIKLIEAIKTTTSFLYALSNLGKHEDDRETASQCLKAIENLK